MADMLCLIWDQTDEYWNLEEALWNECIPIINKIRRKIADTADPYSSYNNNYEKLKEQEKLKIIRLIMYRNGIKFEQQKSLREYKVTIEDIKSLIDDYKERIKIEVSDAKVI